MASSSKASASAACWRHGEAAENVLSGLEDVIGEMMFRRAPLTRSNLMHVEDVDAESRGRAIEAGPLRSAFNISPLAGGHYLVRRAYEEF